MTQSSRPQADNKNNGYVDAGPYSRDEWAKKLIIEWVGDAVTTRGPFAKYGNRLAVTNPAGTTIRVADGAGYCNGSLLDNTANVDFAANVPSISSRTDKVVLVENNTNASYDGTPSGVTLDFPSTLTDYEGTASVPAYSCRLAILRGDAATGNPTTPVQTSDYWMIELYRYDISSGGVISNLTDNRDYVDAEEKTLYVLPAIAYNFNTSSDVVISTAGGTYNGPLLLLLKAGVQPTTAFGRFIVPSDFIESLQVYAIVGDTTSVNGNIAVSAQVAMGQCGQSTWSRTANMTKQAQSITGNLNNCISLVAPSNALKNDIVIINFSRYGQDALDTLTCDLAVYGFKVTYLGYR